MIMIQYADASGRHSDWNVGMAMIRRGFALRAPAQPGVYFFRDGTKKTLYVGKAKSLRERLSYYQNKNLLDSKTVAMLKTARSINWLPTVSESDALILESDLIKKEKPKYNRILKDDKSYQYLKIEKVIDNGPASAESSLGGQLTIDKFSKVILVRKKEDDGANYFGPYPVGSSIKTILKYLRKIYNFRDCSSSKFKRHQRLGRGCLYFDFKLCGAPCAGLINEAEYQKNIKGLKKFMRRGSLQLEDRLEKNMQKSARFLHFEQAQALKIKLDTLRFIRSVKFSPQDYIENPFLRVQNTQTELRDLIKFYNQKSSRKLSSKSPFRIEAYDVSHLSGSSPTASMVAFVDGESRKNEYRRFKVETKGINDYEMLKGVVERRLAHDEWPQPDLILVDGGLGQVKAVTMLANNIPLMGLAKRLERPVLEGTYYSLKTNRPALNLLKRIRDEAHRFAKSYHKLLRSKIE